MVDYFELFGYPITFRIDTQELKSRYFKLSRAFHPDHFTLESQEKQDEVNIKSGQINAGYKILNDEVARIKYILELNNQLINHENQALPETFLMEMMEINESIFELQLDFDAQRLEKIYSEINKMDGDLKSLLLKNIDDFENQTNMQIALENIKDYYLKSKYLLRIRENLSTFAGS